MLNKIEKRNLSEYIDTNKIDHDIYYGNIPQLHFNVSGECVIVSLTTIPRRIHKLKYVLYSLLKQSFLPNSIVVWLSVEEFPRRELSLPPELLSMKHNGVEFLWTKNIRSYKKLIPSLKRFKNCVIITADDDIFYPFYWLEILISEHIKDKDSIIAHRIHEVKFYQNGDIKPYSEWNRCISFAPQRYSNFMTGGGGVLYPANVNLHKDVLQEELFQNLSPYGDDIWFWMMSILAGHKIKLASNCISHIADLYCNESKENTLYYINGLQGKNDTQIGNLMKKYPRAMKILHNEYFSKIKINNLTPCIIYGAGEWGRLAYSYLEENYNILFYVDRNFRKINSIFDKKVYAVDTLLNYTDIVVIVAVNNSYDIELYLKSINFREIYKFYPNLGITRLN